MPKINTYTDNASIENDDKLLTYDTQAAATKLTAFSTIWTWIQNKFNALTKQTAIAAADQLLMVKNGNTTGRIDYNVLAKAIIEQYAGSTLAGSNQSLQAAITALNSNIGYVSMDSNVLDYALSLPDGAHKTVRYIGEDYSWVPDNSPNYRYGLFVIERGGTSVILVRAYSWNGALHRYNFYGNKAWQGWR